MGSFQVDDLFIVSPWAYPFKALVYYLLIEEMVCLDHQDRFVIVSALAYMVIH